MNRKQALETLLAKTELNGGISIDDAGDAFDDAKQILVVVSAYRGSLDAALALHEAVLPGWIWLIRETGECFLHSPDFDSVTWTAGDHTRTDILSGLTVSTQDDNPARAWLMAIIKALIALETEKAAHPEGQTA